MKNNIPKVSVVIPLYNKAPHISRALISILSQTEQSFEIIVVDGHSTDNGKGIVNSFRDSRIAFFEQSGSGVSNARNEGIFHSRSDFVTFIDADDEWMPDHLETLLRLRKAFPDAGMYTTAYLVKYSNSILKMANYHAIQNRPFEGLLPSYFRSAAFGDPPVWTSVVGIPTDILMEMHGFNNEAWWGEDTDLWGRIALKYPVAFSWNGIGIYHTESINRACNKVRSFRENIFVESARKAIEAGEVPLEIQDDLQEYIALKQIQTACCNLAAGRSDLAKDNLRKCKTRYLRKSKYWVLFWSYIPNKIFLNLKNLKSTAKERFSNAFQGPFDL